MLAYFLQYLLNQSYSYSIKMLSKYLCRFRPLMSTSHLQKIQQLFNDKKYAEILQINNIASPTYSQVKSNYYRLIKKYHSDNCQEDEKKAKIYEEISKIIIRSYHELDKEKFSHHKPSQGYQEPSYVEEDEICMELFNKKFVEVKYWMYEEGNQKAKDAFFKKLFEKTGKGPSPADSNNYASSSSSNNERKVYNPQTAKKEENSNQGSQKMLGGVGLIVLAGLFVLGYFKNKKAPELPKQPEKKKGNYTQEAIDQIVNKRLEKVVVKRQKMIDSIIKDHPPSLHIPFEVEPHLMKQLTEYSIAPDIHLYEVDPKWFEENARPEVIKNGFDPENAFELKRIKPNTVMTLSLETERALQNTYVKVKDVIEQIKKTGTFKPPKIFFRFHGYIMAEIREKPITLANYRDTDYISVFDLYFEYYSPIWLKKDCFSEYLVGKDELQYFGYVHMNTRKCDPVYMSTGDKAVYFLPKVFQAHALSEPLWKNYYLTYHRNWLPDN